MCREIMIVYGENYTGLISTPWAYSRLLTVHALTVRLIRLINHPKKKNILVYISTHCLSIIIPNDECY